MSFVLGVTAVVIFVVRDRVSTHEGRRIAWEISTSVENSDRLEREKCRELTIHLPSYFQDPQVLSFLERPPVDFLPVVAPFLDSIGFCERDAFAAVFVLPPEEGDLAIVYPPEPIPGDVTYEAHRAALGRARTLLEDPGLRAKLPLNDALFESRVFPRLWTVHDGRLFRVLCMPIESYSRPGEPVAAVVLLREATDRYALDFILRSREHEAPAVPPPQETVLGWLGLGGEAPAEVASDAVFVVGDRVVASTRRDLPGLEDLGPAFARAIADRKEGHDHGDAEFHAGAERLIGRWHVLEASEPAAGYVVFKSYDQALVHLTRLQRLLGALGIAVTIFAVLVGIVLTTGIVRPVGRLVGGPRAVEAGRLDVEVPVTTRDEIGDLTRSFNRMVAELRLKEMIKDQFGKYLDPRIVRDLIANPDAAKLGGDKRVMTVYFSDVAGFTSIAESMSPETLVHLLNDYFTLMTGRIVSHEGIVDKFIGDAIMAFWGPPFVPAERHATAACLAAIEQLERLEAFRKDLVGRNLPPIEMRIGISTGEMIVGNVGSEGKQGYTVMGDRVNLASRLEGANKLFGTRAIVDEPTARAAEASIEVREIDEIQVKGKDESVRVFELLGRKGSVDGARRALLDRFARGLDSFRGRDLVAALEHFEACRQADPQDGPTRAFIARLTDLQTRPLKRDWTTVWRLNEK